MTINTNIRLIVYRYNGHRTLKAEKKFTLSAEGIRAANAYVDNQRQRYPKRAFVMLMENKVKRYKSEFRMKSKNILPSSKEQADLQQITTAGADAQSAQIKNELEQEQDVPKEDLGNEGMGVGSSSVGRTKNIVSPLNDKSPDSVKDADEGLFYLIYRDLGN